MATPQRETYFDRFKKLEPINALSDEQISDIVAQSSIERLESGVSLSGNSDDNGPLIYLLSGSIEVQTSDPSDKQLIQGGGKEARYPVLNGATASFQAQTITPVVIARIDRELLDTMLTWGQISVPETEVMMSEDGIITINKADWLKIMMKSPTFRKLPPSNISELLQRLEPVRVHAGEVIIRQGDRGDFFYMINEGTALVTRNPDNDEDSVEMAELGEGTTFGEAALISDNPRNATVSMTSDGILLRLSQEDFNLLLRQPMLQDVVFEDAALKVQGGARWIDVRLPSEYQHGHLPDAINIPMRDLHRLVHQLDPSLEYICYCESGNRSSAASFALSQYGIKALVLKDGLRHVPPDIITH